ncbi:hypothetical protein BDR03DRAFT_985154 [Suillus americanus]|nr:hypothetical protein BDR03DRAFT_985154 [Suillus americanus]
MVRPLIRQTTQEKIAAALRHRDAILKRCRELRSSKSKEAWAEANFSKDLCKALAKALRNIDKDASESESDDDSLSDSDEYKLYDLPECLIAIKKSLLVDDCSTNGDISIIENAMAKVQKLLKDTIPMQDQILNFCGISPEWQATNSVTRFLRTVLAYLEDILSLAMFEGASGLVEAQVLGELLYQKGIRI